MVFLNSEEARKYKPNIIFIDPPYNTGNKSLTYLDSFDDNEWKVMLKTRVEKAIEISDDNSIFYFTIGDASLSNLLLVCTELFKSQPVAIMPRVSNNAGKTTKLISKNCDWLIIYTKGKVELKGVSVEVGSYKLSDKYEDERGKFQLRRLDYKEFKYSKTLDYKIKFNNRIYYPGGIEKWKNRQIKTYDKDWCWMWCEERIKFAIENDFIVAKNDKLWKKTYLKVKIKEEDNEYKIIPTNRNKPIGTLHFADKFFNRKDKELNKQGFTYPKTPNFMYEVINQPMFDEKRVLDLYGGTGVTAIAFNELNKKENLRHSCIVVQWKEKVNADNSGHEYVSEITEDILKSKSIEYQILEVNNE